MLLAYGASEPLCGQKTVYGRPDGILTLTLFTGEVRCCSSSLPSVYMISMKTMIAEMAIMEPIAGIEPAPTALQGRRTTCCAISAYQNYFLLFYFFGADCFEFAGCFSGTPMPKFDFLFSPMYSILYILYINQVVYLRVYCKSKIVVTS